jgi:hypothetical protein
VQDSVLPMTPQSQTEASAPSRTAKRGASSFGWWTDAAAVALVVAVILGLILLSVRSPLHADDYSLLVSIRNHPFLGDYLMYWYTSWIGYLTSLTVNYVALQYPLLWGIANGAAFAALVVLTFAVAGGRWPRLIRRDMHVLAVVLAAYWFTLPAIGETVFWRTGSNYLWATSLMLLFALPYRRWLSSPTATAAPGRVRRIAGSLGWFVFGFAVGCSHLQVVIALCVLLIVFAIKVWQRGLRNVPVALLAGVVGAALGAAVLLLAPGNEIRLAATGAMSLTIAARAHGFITYLASITLRWLPPLIPWLLCLLVAAVPTIKNGEARGKPARVHADRPRAWWIWGLAGVATLAPFIITPANGAERTLFFLPVFLTVAVLSLATDGERRALDFLPPVATSIILAGLMLFVLASVAINVRGQAILSEALHQREQSIAAQKARGVEDVVVPPIVLRGYPYRAIAFFDMTADPASYISVSQADWFGVRTIVVGGEAKLY